MVPMLTCGLLRSNFAFATGMSSWTDFALCSEGSVAAALRMFLRRCCGRSGESLNARARWGELLPRRLRDDFLRDVRGNLGVGVEQHGVVPPALGAGPEVTDVAEHLRQRDQRLHDADARPLLHGLDLTTTGVEVTDDVTHVVL